MYLTISIIPTLTAYIQKRYDYAAHVLEKALALDPHNHLVRYVKLVIEF